MSPEDAPSNSNTSHYGTRPAGGVPQLESPVVVSGNNDPSIRGEGDRPYDSVVSLEGSHERAARRVPELKCSVLASGDNDPSIGGESDRPYCLVVSLEGSRERAARRVPELKCSVLAPGDNDPSIGGEGDSGDGCGMINLRHYRCAFGQDVTPVCAWGSRRRAGRLSGQTSGLRLLQRLGSRLGAFFLLPFGEICDQRRELIRSCRSIDGCGDHALGNRRSRRCRRSRLGLDPYW